ncbi:peptidoglycan-binding protein [Streptomyces sp. NPDC088817]|uniref:peptidoglycan-binding protein n=1 Tax=Streptomyces sp. NPDC088817 TaxID=3365907 RepID=UPI0037FF90E3
MPDPTTQQDEKTAARKKNTPEPEPTPAPEPAASDTNTDRYEPYPGAGFFHGGRHSPIIAAMAVRLQQEGHADRRLGADWTNAHRRAFAAFQESLRPKGGGDTSGIPDQTAWDRLQVSRVSPLPKES